MIYLLDDNKDDKRINSFNVSYVDDGTFKGYLTAISHLPKNADLSFLEAAECLLIHETTEDINDDGQFEGGSTTNARRVIEDIADNGDRIPLVVFSNQMTGPPDYDFDRNPYSIKSINKTTFYQQRLYPFLNYFKNSSKVEMRIIAYGENFVSVEAGRYARYLIESLAIYDRSEMLNLSYFPKLSMLERFFSFINPNGNYNEFIGDLEDSSITIGEFVENVSSVIESISENYGKNTYTWQF